MVTRVPLPATAATPDAYNGGSTIADRLDKGFPYDDGDGTIDDAVPAFKKRAAPSPAVNVAVLNEQNVTKQSLKNLIRDTTSPITQELVQLEGSDGDNVSSLFDSNVTRGALRNLVTDRPAPITVKLAQKGDADNVSALFDSNVTRGALKNLVTDKPAPITTKLAQTMV